MPSIFDSIKEHAEFDLRKAYPDLMEKLGVNTSDEHAVFHATLAFLLKMAAEGVTDEVKALGL